MAKTAIVIGSGFGGMSAAIRLQAMGFDTTIIEKMDKPGGRAYQKVVKVDGIEGEFKFDMGPTVITVPHFIEELLSLENGGKFAPNYPEESLKQWEKIRDGHDVSFSTENKSQSNVFSSSRNIDKYIELVPVSPFYRLYFADGTFFDYDGNYQNTIDQIGKLTNEDEVKGFIEFHKKAAEVFEKGFIALGYNYFGDIEVMLKAVPELLKLGLVRGLFSYVNKFFKHEKTLRIFTFEPLLVGGSPLTVPALYVLIHFVEASWGVHYVQGGTGKLVQALIKKYEELGGKIILNSEIEKIIVENKKAKGVQLKSGEIISSDIVVSNADYGHTYSTLLKDTKKLINNDLRIKHLTVYSMSLVVVYFAFKKDNDPEKDHNLQHHNIVFGKDYVGEMKKLFGTGESEPDYSQYLHLPTKTDPEMAPEGYHTAYTLICVPNKKLSSFDWKTHEKEFVDNVLKGIEKNGYIPNLSKRLVHRSAINPLYFEENLNSIYGNAFGVMPLFRQSAFFRPHNRSEDVKNLYLVGASTMPGAGVPSVMMTAKITTKLIAKDFGIEV